MLASRGRRQVLTRAIIRLLTDGQVRAYHARIWRAYARAFQRRAYLTLLACPHPFPGYSPGGEDFGHV
jgi:hypothetical protein